MIKALLIDDEPSAIKTLKLMLERYIPEITDIQYTSLPQIGLEMISKYHPDILFLDIEMPNLNGFHLLKKIPYIDFSIIFTTAYDQYAIEAIRFSALDYLLKPIDADELKSAFARFKKNKESKEDLNLPLYKNFMHNLNVSNTKDFKLALPTAQGTFFYHPNEIIYIEGESNYSKFFFSNQKSLLTSKTLKEYEEILVGHGFLRIHKSHIINKAHIISCSTDGILTMTNGTKVEISRRRKEDVMLALKTT